MVSALGSSILSTYHKRDPFPTAPTAGRRHGRRTEIRGAGRRIVRFRNQESHCTTVTARLSATHSCSPPPIRRLRRHLPHFVEKGPATTTRSTRPRNSSHGR